MAVANWTSEDLLTRFNALAGRQTSDAITNQTKYAWLGDAQQEILSRIASIAPRVLYGTPTAMSTSDSGATWTFGTDGNGYPLFPIGKASIYPSLQSIPSQPWQPGTDYLDEGIQIRIPGGTTYAGPLYWYGITIPNEISASVEPMLQPPPSRVLIVTQAVLTYAESFARNPALAQTMERRLERQFGPWMTTLRTHFRGGGALGNLLVPYLGPTAPAVWW